MSEHIAWGCGVAGAWFLIWACWSVIRDYERRDEMRRRVELSKIEREGRPDPWEESERLLTILRGEAYFLPTMERVDGNLRYEWAMSYPLPPKRWVEHIEASKEFPPKLPPPIEGLAIDAETLHMKLMAFYEEARP